MNNIEHDYLKLLNDIMTNGVEKSDRTGTGTISVFGRQIRHDMSLGFPLLTTKKMAWKSIVTELLWFLRGDTNIKYLVDNGCHVWDGDAYKAYLNDKVTDPDACYSKEEFINQIKTNAAWAKAWGELGPIYGAQWREWGAHYETNLILGTRTKRKPGLDQIAKLVEDLKTNPDSRRLMVSAWNVDDLDAMKLPPCHYGFQVYTRELSLDEIASHLSKMKNGEHYKFKENEMLTEKEYYEALGLPTRAISLMWNQRSVDTFLGLPFNIASYGLLLKIIAKEVNMIPDELIGNLGDVHLYSNHLDQAKEQITREPMKLPELYCLDEYHYLTDEELVGPIPFDEKIKQFRPDFFTMHNYQSHPAIKAPLSN